MGLLLTKDEADMIRQWYNCIEDTNKIFLSYNDNVLFRKIEEFLESTKEPT